MKLRVRLKRHSVLANMFCRADEGVAAAQGRLAEAQAERRRVLAALAVTVGSDVATARLVGLSDREVRSARRSVGKRAARALAHEVLSQRSGENAAGAGAAAPPVAAALVAPEPVFEQDPWATTWLPSEDALLLRAWPASHQIHELAQRLEKPAEAVLARLLVLSPQSAAASGAATVRPDAVVSRPGPGRHRRLHVVHPDQTEVNPPVYPMYDATGT